MKKISLDKQKVVTLSQDEMNQLNGGGYDRSNRRGGSCWYSRRHQLVVLCCGEPRVLGCYQAASPFSESSVQYVQQSATQTTVK